MIIHQQGCRHHNSNKREDWLWIFGGWQPSVRGEWARGELVMGRDASMWDRFPYNWEFVVIWPDLT